MKLEYTTIKDEDLFILTDLSGSLAVISIEPSPDNSPAPFTLKSLFHTIPLNTSFHTGYTMDNNALATNPVGTVSK